MPATLDRSPVRTSPPAETSAADRLRTDFAAVRVGFTWLGVRKSLSHEQRAQAAESFGAEGRYLSAAKKLLDTTHPAFSAVSALRSQIVSYWKGLSLSYPEPGLRLIRQSEVEPFNQHLTEFRQLLAEAVANLERHFDDLKRKPRNGSADCMTAATTRQAWSGCSRSSGTSLPSSRRNTCCG